MDTLVTTDEVKGAGGPLSIAPTTKTSSEFSVAFNSCFTLRLPFELSTRKNSSPGPPSTSKWNIPFTPSSSSLAVT